MNLTCEIEKCCEPAAFKVLLELKGKGDLWGRHARHLFYVCAKHAPLTLGYLDLSTVEALS